MKINSTQVLQGYELLVDKADGFFLKVQQTHGACVKCEPHCSDCCHAVFGLFLIEAAYLKRHFDVTDNVCAYALTRVRAERECDAILLAGSDDTIAAWVNGANVLARNVYRGAAIDQEKVAIRLREGENTILLKVCQGGGAWQFYCRLGSAFGLPLTEGVRYGF